MMSPFAMRLPLIAALCCLQVTAHTWDPCFEDQADEDHLLLLQESVALVNKEAPSTSVYRQAQLKLGGTFGGIEQADLVHALLVLVAIIAVIALVMWASGRGRQMEALLPAGSAEAEAEDIEIRPNEPFDEDTYMLAVSIIARDAQFIATGKGDPKLRMARLSFVLSLLAVTILLQVMVMVTIKLYVTPQIVAGIRDAYNQYELAMYGEENVVYTGNGEARGVPGYFNPDNFDTLDEDLKSAVCNIPMSELVFLYLILCVWCSTFIAQIKRCVESFISLIFATKTVDSMVDALESTDTDENSHEKVIVGLTTPIKLAMVVFIFLPWLCTTIFVGYLGCRWITACNDFGNVVSNCVALEFILQFKSIMYFAMVSERSKRDLGNTLMAPPWKHEPAGWFTFFNSTLWGLATLLWVYLYIFFFQQVLVDYRWDVHSVCNAWYAQLLSA